MTSEPMTSEQIAEIRKRGPVGYHCDHSDEPYDARTHHAWEYVEDEGFVFQHMPDVVSANWGPRDHLSPERRRQRCPRALPVYDADVPALLDEVEGRLPLGDVDLFLRRERDEYEPRGECWNTVNDVLDALRLHVVTGIPLTEPRPQGGPEAFGVGKEPLTEAEELRIEVRRLTEERDQAIAHDRQPYPTQWAYDQACAALEKHRQRADAAEAVMRRALAEVEHEEVVYLLNRYLAAAGAQS